MVSIQPMPGFPLCSVLPQITEQMAILGSVHMIHILDSIIFLTLLWLIEMLICVTNFFEFGK